VNESAEDARASELARSYRHSGEVLVRMMRPRMLAIARRLGLDLAAAKDVAQQAFYELFAKRPQLRNVEGWLVRVVTRRGLDWKRRERRLESRAAAPPSPAHPEEALSAEERLSISTVVARLSGRSRALVEARYFEGHSETDAAILAGYSPSSYKKTMTRALRAMRRDLEKEPRRPPFS
jgi:RNA polymerase sigma-70 factor (ECF subfamily)